MFPKTRVFVGVVNSTLEPVGGQVSRPRIPNDREIVALLQLLYVCGGVRIVLGTSHERPTVAAAAAGTVLVRAAVV